VDRRGDPISRRAQSGQISGIADGTKKQGQITARVFSRGDR
jgi:hypothetical protein